MLQHVKAQQALSMKACTKQQTCLNYVAEFVAECWLKVVALTENI